MNDTTKGHLIRGALAANNVQRINWPDGVTDKFDEGWTSMSPELRAHMESLGRVVFDMLAPAALALDDTDKTRLILKDVHRERLRQNQLKSEGKFAYTCADSEMTQSDRLAVLGEEFGEVCHEVNEGIGVNRKVILAKLRKELVQVAAVCVAWVESVDNEIAKP